MRLRFRIRTAPSSASGTQVDRVVEAEPVGGEVRLGRRAGLEVELPFSAVSSRHAAIIRQGRRWAVVDLGSVNGTFVGGRRLAPRAPEPLAAGTELKLADVFVSFEGEVGTGASSAPSAPTESTATLARRLVNDLFRAMGGPEVARVKVVGGPADGRVLTLALPDRPYRVGRAPDCDLALPDEDVSREHAVFERRWQGVFVRDLGSKNGVEIDGQVIRDERRLRDGERVVVGSTELVIDDPEDRYLAQMHRAADAEDPGESSAAEALPPPRQEGLGAARAAIGLAVVALIVVAALAGWLLLGQE